MFSLWQQGEHPAMTRPKHPHAQQKSRDRQRHRFWCDLPVDDSESHSYRQIETLQGNQNLHCFLMEIWTSGSQTPQHSGDCTAPQQHQPFVFCTQTRMLDVEERARLANACPKYLGCGNHTKRYRFIGLDSTRGNKSLRVQEWLSCKTSDSSHYAKATIANILEHKMNAERGSQWMIDSCQHRYRQNCAQYYSSCTEHAQLHLHDCL